MVGDLHTAALISTEGSIDWLCLPRFDSPACFNALLDTPRAGRWLLALEDGGECTRRRYRKGTLILETELETSTGKVNVIEAGRQLGNTPQAFSHFALVMSALELHEDGARRSDAPAPGR